MKWVLAILLIAALMLTASTLSVYADDDEGDEGEDDEGDEGGDDDGASRTPGFEVAFAIAGALAAARIVGRKD